MTPRSRIVTRLEPYGPAPLAGVLAARLADPLWLLARQWQFGELLGESAGTVIEAEVSVTISPLTHLAAGHPMAGWPAAMDTDPLDPIPPLDALVQAAPIERHPLWRRADGGRMLVCLAKEAGLDALAEAAVAAYPLGEAADGDADGCLLWTLLRGTLPDGQDLHDALAPLDLTDDAVTLPPELAAAGSGLEVRDMLLTWLELWTPTLPLSPQVTAWDPESLTHRFALASATTEATTVFAADHPGGPLDWHHITAAVTAKALPDAPAPQRRTLRLPPDRIRFPGMPAERWWQVDDQVIDLGAIDAGAADLVRLLVLDFAVSYGGDAWHIPLRLPLPTWTTVDSLVITDSFGDMADIPAAASPNWTMFTIADRPGLLLLGTDAARLDGEPADRLTLARDEPANLAWLIEERWEGGSGEAIERQNTLPKASAPSPTAGIDLFWRLVDDPPGSWLPLLPTADDRLGPSLTRLSLPGSQIRSALARDVAETLPDRIVPRSGLTIERRPRLAFDPHGQRRVWVARGTRTAVAGTGTSALQWDRAQPPQAQE